MNDDNFKKGDNENPTDGEKNKSDQNIHINLVNTTKIFHSVTNDNLKTEKKKLNFNTDDDFQVIDRNEISQSQMMKNYSVFESRQTYPQHNNSYPNKLIKESIIPPEELNGTKQKLSNSVWSSFTNKISNLTNSLKYNIISTNSTIKLNNLKYVRLFDQIFNEEHIKSGEMESYLDRIIQFTYRSDFLPIVYEGYTYTSDCGWGCMIRAAQMILSKCILENKIFHHMETLKKKENSESVELTEDELNKLKYKTLLLFFDNNVKIEDIKRFEDFAYLKKNKEIVLNKGEYNLGEVKQNFNEKEQFLSTEINPPFSIQNICKLGSLYGKGAGIWFSDVIMMGIFSEINKQFQVLQNMEMIYFNDGMIDENVIFENCFQLLQCRAECEYLNEWTKKNQMDKTECDYDINQIEEFINKLEIKENSLNDLSDENTKTFPPICSDCEIFYISNPEYLDRLIKIDSTGKLYLMKKGGAIFVSTRLGLDAIPKEYFTSISHIFKIPNNLGIIGGKKNSALYFIGEYMDKLIYLDPHVNQLSIKDAKSLQIASNFLTYTCKYFYQTHISNISPAFTTAFYFRSLNEFKMMAESFSIHSSLSFPTFKFRSINQESTQKKVSNKGLSAEEVGVEDDFCIIDYK